MFDSRTTQTYRLPARLGYTKKTDFYSSLTCNPIKMFGKECNKNNSPYLLPIFFYPVIWVKAKESQYLYVIIKLWFLQFFLPFNTHDAINKYFKRHFNLGRKI